MLTRVEIDGFKTFERFELDLRPFTVIVGPNASGKSNLFDALRFLSLLSQHDVRSAMQDLRGEPEELFRWTEEGSSDHIRFAVEVLLDSQGTDAFGTAYQLKAQRLRYELELTMRRSGSERVRGIYVSRETCVAIPKKDDLYRFPKGARINYSGQLNPFIRMRDADDGEARAIEVRQDGATKRGRPVTLPAIEASRSALSTIATAEFPHLYALKDLLASTRFLEINPQAARKSSDRFEQRTLKPDASNLAAVLAGLKDETSDEKRPDGVLSDISMDLASLIPSVRSVQVFNDPSAKEYSFGISTKGSLDFSSRVISDGTLRLLALLTVLDDPNRRGVLCFEEPENGVHEGRIPALISFLRHAATDEFELGSTSIFQIIMNTHSPAVMAALKDDEIVAADSVTEIDPQTGTSSVKTRMRSGVWSGLQFNPEHDLTRRDVDNLLRRPGFDA